MKRVIIIICFMIYISQLFLCNISNNNTQIAAITIMAIDNTPIIMAEAAYVCLRK